MEKRRTEDAHDPQFDIRGTMWNMHLGLVRAPLRRATTLEDRIRLIEEEQAIRDLLVRYIYCYDADDLDGVMSVFHDDCVLINPRGTYIGSEAIRRNYAHRISERKIGFHYAPNVAVRVAEDGQQAWMTAYYYAVGGSQSAGLSGTGGTYADRLIKVDGEWKIIERRITFNLRHVLTPAQPKNATPPPVGTIAESSRDIIGPSAEM